MAPASPWAQVLQVGLKILSHFLGGGAAAGDGIDKVDNSSPMQVSDTILFLTQNQTGCPHARRCRRETLLILRGPYSGTADNGVRVNKDTILLA